MPYDGRGGHWNRVVLAVEIPLVLLAISTVALRVYSRLTIKRRLAVDDILIICGCACALARTVISCMSADDGFGYDARGRPDRPGEVTYYQHIFERRIAYIFAVSFTRFSVLAYYLRIFPPGLITLRRWCWVLLALALAQFTEVLTVLLVSCRDIGKLWTGHWQDFAGSMCFTSASYSYSAAIGDSVLDSMIFALPIPYVWRLSRVKTSQRIGLVVIFALGFIVCVVALLQIPFIRRRETKPTYFGGAINMLIAIQISLAIVAASLPDLRALLARSFPHFSPLHHRSLNNNPRSGTRDVEEATAENEEERSRRRSNLRKPDWMRSSIPASLLSTTITRDDASMNMPQSRPPMVCRNPSVIFPWATKTETVSTLGIENIQFLDGQPGRRPSLAPGQQAPIAAIRRPSLAEVLNCSAALTPPVPGIALPAPACTSAANSLIPNTTLVQRPANAKRRRSNIHNPKLNKASAGWRATTQPAGLPGSALLIGGTAGCLLAHRLSHAQSRPSVLLVEAGTKPEGDFLLEPFHRYTPAFLRPDLNWGYESVPQKALNGRSIAYARGKGLGGSSIMNFSVYLYGSKEDYDRWAELVGDDTWKWEHTKETFKRIENFDVSGAKEYAHVASPDPAQHGHDGTVKVGLPAKLEKGTLSALDAIHKNGEALNLDFNSGDPMGFGVFPATYSESGRTTSANAHLTNPPANLTIWTGAAVHRLKLEGAKVVGIEAADGRKAKSRKEVILCGGTIDTPKILLLNGIGPASELEAFGIPVVKDLPGVGKQLRDHLMTFLVVEVDATHNDKYALESNQNMILEAAALWNKDKTGPFSLHHSNLWGAFLKLPGIEDSPEFKSLDQDVQDFLRRDTVPHCELAGNALLFPPGTTLPEGSGYLSMVAFLMNPQSTGSITLRSANPEDSPVIDLGFMEHAYDKRAMRETVRLVWQKVFENPDIKKDIKKPIYGPESLSDEDIDTFNKDAVSTVWHANGSVVMGKKDNAMACVDANFRVYGIEGLRVADVSVCPVTTNNHTQSTAYLVGQKAADKLIAEYGL
ncbi:FAD/NAD(P)-binding domain-containing protein [Polyplosphaeria fusca]|uniref:FAD/NAD(P)-binding domain-containing protein n=1 Tax=Polyplosphaeria fusca TaxID=682080 RepID=A0A9P4V5N1_9PLEO|nr:FAD/NAD(P)-binding domain-containing protein [Polyplosphaeria fusca]